MEIVIGAPILPGTAYESRVKCGKNNCRCHDDPAKRHTVYQWSGDIGGKNTSRSLNKAEYLECKERIARYKQLRSMFKTVIEQALEQAPWQTRGCSLHPDRVCFSQ